MQVTVLVVLSPNVQACKNAEALLLLFGLSQTEKPNHHIICNIY